MLDTEQQKELDIALTPLLMTLLRSLHNNWGLSLNESFYEISKSLSRLEKEANREANAGT